MKTQEDLYTSALELVPDINNEDLVLTLAAWDRLQSTTQTAEGKLLAGTAYRMCERLVMQITKLRKALGLETSVDFERPHNKIELASQDVH